MLYYQVGEHLKPAEEPRVGRHFRVVALLVGLHPEGVLINEDILHLVGPDGRGPAVGLGEAAIDWRSSDTHHPFELAGNGQVAVLKPATTTRRGILMQLNSP